MEEGESFAWMLAGAAGSRGAKRTPEQSARAAAEEFISVALVQPILQQLRSQNQAAEPFAPGDAERSFGAIFDAEIARRITQRADFPLVESVARALLRSQGTGADRGAPAASIDLHG